MEDERISSERLLDSWLQKSRSTIVIKAAANRADVEAMKRMGLSPASVLGGVVKRYGCILCGNRHIRLLGGANGSCASLPELNKAKDAKVLLRGLLIVGDTSEGGIFAVNCSRETGTAPGEILYLPGDSLVWERLEIGYSGFVEWAISTTEEELVDGKWIDDRAKFIQLPGADAILRGKIGMIIAMHTPGE